MIVYAMTNYDIYTNETLTIQPMNNNKHSTGLHSDLIKVDGKRLIVRR